MPTGTGSEVVGPDAYIVLPRSVFSHAIAAGKGDPAAGLEPRGARILDHPGALVAENQRCLRARMAARQDRMIEWRYASGGHAHENPFISDLGLGGIKLGQVPDIP